MLSSHAEKAARPMPPRLAADARTPALCRRMQRCSSIDRRGVGMAGDRVNAIRAVGTTGVTERIPGVNEIWSGTTGRALHPMSVARHSSSFSSRRGVGPHTTIIQFVGRNRFIAPFLPRPTPSAEACLQDGAIKRLRPTVLLLSAVVRCCVHQRSFLGRSPSHPGNPGVQHFNAD